MAVRAISSKDLGPALGLYSHGVVAAGGELVIVAGQVGTDATGRLVGPGDAGAQTKQAFDNIARVLAAAGCTMRDVVRFQTFLTHASDIDRFMAARREVFPTYYPDEVYPPNTLLVVSRLVQPELLVEIEAMAVRPAAGSRSERAARPRPAARRAGRPGSSKRRR